MVTNRKDMTKYLIHWCKSESGSYDEAFQCLLDIVISEKLIGSSTFIKGKHRVICFSEAPIKEVLSGNHDRYLPFGISFLKETIFEKGGRPVIYQAPNEYNELPSSMQWRHVSYDPTGGKKCDFTWEREWRINIDELALNPLEMLIVLPSIQWKDKFIHHYRDRQINKNYMYEVMMGPGCGLFPEDPKYCILELVK